jgi:tetratricopeptide (TPR) repeat protein
VGEAIEALYSDRLEDEAHRLAYHLYEARDDERSLKYSMIAGDAAARLCANTEAIKHYAHAIEVGLRGGASNEQLIRMYTKQGSPLELSSQHEGALETYQALEALGEERQEPELVLGAVLPQATVFSTLSGNFDPARGEELANRALALARELGDTRGEAKALWNLALGQYFASLDHQKAIDYSEQSIACSWGSSTNPSSSPVRQAPSANPSAICGSSR